MEKRSASGLGVRVLLVRFSAIGDCAMAAHTASCIRRSYPADSLVWVVEERCAPVVDTERLATAKEIFQRAKWKRRAWSVRTYREQFAFFARLRAYRFDIGLDLQGHSKTAICLRLAKPARRLAVRATDGLARMLNPVAKGLSGHTVERQRQALRQLGTFLGDSTPIMPPLKAERSAVRQRTGPGPYAVIAVGAGQPWKAYSQKNWATVAPALTLPVIFVGGPGESAPKVPGAIDLVGKLDLAETMAAIAESRIVLAADTGAGHLAAAYGVPVVSIFGPTDPAEFRPYTSKGIVLRKGESPDLVTPDSVAAAAKELLTAR